MVFSGFDIYSKENRAITVENGVISKIETISEAEANGRFLSRTMLDAQVNGYAGIDYSGNDLTEEGILRLCTILEAAGVYRHVPTIITNSQARILDNLRIIANAVKNNEKVAKAIVGIHVEGPYISPYDGPRGAHELKYVRDPSIDELYQWIDASNNLVKIITIAPEKKGAVEFIQEAVKNGICISIGHCSPSEEEINAAVDAGARMSTHLGNGSHAELPRLRNYIWQQLANDNLTAGFISDGYHLPPYVIKTMYRTKGIDNLVAVSDVAPPGGLPEGRCKWGNTDVEVCPDGHLALAGTSLLAGAGHLLDHDIPFFMNVTGASLEEAMRMVTCNPLRMLGQKQVVNFEVGESADILCFDIMDARIRVHSGLFV